MRTMIDRADITGIVLAGGRGRRMGGVDKGLVDFAGRPLVAHVIERFAPQVGAIVINANQNVERYAAFGAPVVRDAIGGFAGPLAGLHAGLSVFALTRRDVLPHLAAFLDGGGRKIDAWYATLAVIEVPFDDEADAFRNINTAEELAASTLTR